ncbi:unnamed protein product [Ambrosiozyma monospora]|uniref:Unnamed protein product n=1 Tax=Ambrosiozyma monospora TaxID=43982 RepID=A0ACB5T8E5_AMBMO|nr:unnamed protein product [Ambrosiozyma monospora]
MLDKNDFGDFVFKLEYKCKSFLQDNGWYSGDQEWKDLPVSLIPEIVNSNQFFVPTEFDRIVFATRLFQLSDSPETDIKVVLKMFKSQLCFFTLTYNQQLYLLKLKLKSGEPIFDESMVKASNKLSKHLQNTTCSDKGSPISTEKSPDGTAFPKYRYPVGISDGAFRYRSYSYATTVIPPFRFSIALDNASKKLTKNKIYFREFSYCGRVWRYSMYNIKDSLKIAIKRMPRSCKRPSYKTYGKYFIVPRVKTELKDCKMPGLPLSAESFQVGPTFRDRRENVSVYYKVSLRSNDSLEDRIVNERSVFELENPSTDPSMDFDVVLPLKDINAVRPLILNVVIGVI